jgi:predicted nucleic acid-binding protein
LNTYFDTGVLLKVYVQELNSAEAIALVSKFAPPIPFTHFHTIELFTAIRLKRFRAEINANEEKTAIQVLRADITNERLQLPDYDLLQLFRRAEVLSAKYAAIFGTRTLDILHVAAALEAECTEFVSFDERQRKVAAKERLTVVPHQLQKQSKP